MVELSQLACQLTKVFYTLAVLMGKKINIGLDIINGLQNIFGVSAPIFIDNAEAVSDWLVESNSQLIKMYVNENVKSLEIVKEA